MVASATLSRATRIAFPRSVGERISNLWRKDAQRSQSGWAFGLSFTDVRDTPNIEDHLQIVRFVSSFIAHGFDFMIGEMMHDILRSNSTNPSNQSSSKPAMRTLAASDARAISPLGMNLRLPHQR